MLPKFDEWTATDCRQAERQIYQDGAARTLHESLNNAARELLANG